MMVTAVPGSSIEIKADAIANEFYPDLENNEETKFVRLISL